MHLLLFIKSMGLPWRRIRLILCIVMNRLNSLESKDISKTQWLYWDRISEAWLSHDFVTSIGRQELVIWHQELCKCQNYTRNCWDRASFIAKCRGKLEQKDRVMLKEGIYPIYCSTFRFSLKYLLFFNSSYVFINNSKSNLNFGHPLYCKRALMKCKNRTYLPLATCSYKQIKTTIFEKIKE